MLVSPADLLAAVANQRSAFLLDVTVDRFDGATYHPGETYTVPGTTEQDGFLYLFRIDPDATTRLLFPLPGQDNRVSADQRFTAPAEGGALGFPVPAAEGTYRVKAIVTRGPVYLTGLLAVMSAQPAANRPGLPRDGNRGGGLGGPEQHGGPKLGKWHSAFAQDEVVFHVEPADEAVPAGRK
jgi:hypothetical protein